MDIREPVIKKLHPHPFYYLGFYFSGIIFLFLGFLLSEYLFLVGFFVFILAEISRYAETYYILESGIARQHKLFSTSRKFAEFDKIQNIEVTQSFLENILGIGNVHLDTAGADKQEVSFHGIKDPYRIENIIREKMK